MSDELKEILGVIIGGMIFFTLLTVFGVGIWSLLDYNFIITALLVVAYGLGQFVYTYIKNPRQDIYGLWFIYWFENQWYKLVLLLTGMRAFALWV